MIVLILFVTSSGQDMLKDHLVGTFWWSLKYCVLA